MPKTKMKRKGRGIGDLIHSIIDEIPIIGALNSKLRKLKPLSRGINFTRGVIDKVKGPLETIGYGKKKRKR